MKGLDDAWERYLAVLDAKAPRSRALIRPSNPADSVIVDAGVTVSDELRRWFSFHAGVGMTWEAGAFAPDNLLISVREAVSDTVMVRQIWQGFAGLDHDASGAGAGEVAGTWLPEYLFIGSDTMGGGLFVDNRAGTLHGCVRYWDKINADDDFGEGVIAANLTSFLTDLASAVETGQPLKFEGRLRPPRPRDGVLDWDEDAEAG